MILWYLSRCKRFSFHIFNTEIMFYTNKNTGILLLITSIVYVYLKSCIANKLSLFTRKGEAMGYMPGMRENILIEFSKTFLVKLN